MDNKEIMILAGWVKISTYRERVMLNLGTKLKTPTVLAKDAGIKINHISKILSDLKKKELIECINEEARKGRLYHVTDLGLEVMQKTKMINDE